MPPALQSVLAECADIVADRRCMTTQEVSLNSQHCVQTAFCIALRARRLLSSHNMQVLHWIVDSMRFSKMHLADTMCRQPHLYCTLCEEGAHVPLAAQLGELDALGCG